MNNLGRNTEITQEQVAFYRARAAGGCALVITEGLAVHPTGVPNETVPFAFDPSLIRGLGQIAKAIHDAGAVALGQLWHVGRQALWNPAIVAWAPSNLRDPFSGTTPHAMTEVEVREIISAFVRTARNLRDASFDGVELHAAHGYLLTQFLSPWSNTRDDRWGGDSARRVRIVTEIIRGIRAECGDAFVVGVKISAHEYVTGGIDLPLAQEVVSHLVRDAPPDYIAASQANFSPSLERHVPDMRFPDMPFVELARGIREVSRGAPVMALAKIPDIAAADLLIRRGDADLIGMSRALIADARLVAKAETGEVARPCIYCNVCWQAIQTHRSILCIYAPDEEAVSPTPARRRVRVVGAGLAGLEVARIAALRGHAVDLYDARDHVGGRLALEATIPGREALGHAAAWLDSEIRRFGVQVHLNCLISASEVTAWTAQADEVVLSTGAEPIVDPLPGAQAVVSLEDALANADRLVDPIAIVDEIDDEPVYAFAELLAGKGRDVILLTKRAHVGRNVPYVNLIGVLRRLDDLGIAQHVLAAPVRIEHDALVACHPFSGHERRIRPVRLVVRAGPYRSRAPTVPRPGVTLVGDALAPRALSAVFREAHEFALRL